MIRFVIAVTIFDIHLTLEDCTRRVNVGAAQSPASSTCSIALQ
jgi:hypothetical protein